MTQKKLTRFASVEDVMDEEFRSIWQELDRINVEYMLPDHWDVNRERYPWSDGLLNRPELYAARMWEYPFAILSAELKAEHKCLDVGCGRTPFTIYLKEISKCDVTGVDPDVFQAGIRHKGFGVSLEFVNKTGLKIKQGTFENLPFPSNSFDRVFCISVIEHIPRSIRSRGMQEIARVLKPGGRAIITVDINMHSEVTAPLDLIRASGLLPYGEMDLRWKFHRFGNSGGKEPVPIDVFGMTLIKPNDYYVETDYSRGKKVNTIEGSLIPTLCKPSSFSEINSKILKLYEKHRIVRGFMKVINKII